MKRLAVINVMIIFVFMLAACGGAAPATKAAVPVTGNQISGLDKYGERYDADPAVLKKAVGTTEGVPQIAQAAFYRAGLPVSPAMQALAIKCFKELVCDTGTGGKITVALADGFGENF